MSIKRKQRNHENFDSITNMDKNEKEKREETIGGKGDMHTSSWLRIRSGANGTAKRSKSNEIKQKNKERKRIRTAVTVHPKVATSKQKQNKKNKEKLKSNKKNKVAKKTSMNTVISPRVCLPRPAPPGTCAHSGCRAAASCLSARGRPRGWPPSGPSWSCT